MVSDGKVDAIDMFERYADEAENDDKTRRLWRIKIRLLMSLVGHDGLARLTVDNVIARKDKLLKTKKRQSRKDKKAKKPEQTLDPKTIRDSYLAAVKATLNYAKQQRKLSQNVASEVTVRVRRKKKQREKGFTEEEALLILKATLAPASPNMSEEHAKARRWYPGSAPIRGRASTRSRSSCRRTSRPGRESTTSGSTRTRQRWTSIAKCRCTKISSGRDC
ncbi:hypothetical protein AS156_29420 [Bradyrhizobium macuxiense]|uniref:Core-binding (CB) domain-containing protein n=1 Tax=Bradyrhizobium macuxiense TaxID=1755647 RepID=A0A120FRR3_9BRAD|nr:hypothetical protein [Bradyrhizobium macuxiense]KWV60499.1 hypothetical protein AS156_29420 [Bradyrhizobium macuxiense]